MKRAFGLKPRLQASLFLAIKPAVGAEAPWGWKADSHDDDDDDP